MIKGININDDDIKYLIGSTSINKEMILKRIYYKKLINKIISIYI